MKNWIYAALAALFATGCAPHGGYTLTGEVPEAWEGKPVVLFTTDAGQAEAIDSTTVANGKFRLQGVLDAPRNCRVAVYLDPENRSDRNLTVTFPVFLDSTAVNAVCDASKSDPVFTLAGGATQTEWQAYRAGPRTAGGGAQPCIPRLCGGFLQRRGRGQRDRTGPTGR